MRTQDAKNIHCNDYLDKIGAKLARTQNGTHGLENVYHSPLREDQKPSLCVNLGRNIWSDVPAEVGGRLIELVCYTNLMQTDVKSALGILDRLFPEYRGTGYAQNGTNTPNHVVDAVLSLPISTPTRLKENGPSAQLVRAGEIYRYPLKNYLAERKIPLEIAKRYLQEIEYTDARGRMFYALGWKCGETYGLRSKTFKGFLGKGIDCTILDKQSKEIYVFEGIFDFLSYLSSVKRPKLAVTVVIMNSVALRSRFEGWVAENPHIARLNCYFDNDASGQSCFKNLEANFPDKQVQDYSHLYSYYKDFSDWFQAQ